MKQRMETGTFEFIEGIIFQTRLHEKKLVQDTEFLSEAVIFARESFAYLFDLLATRCML